MNWFTQEHVSSKSIEQKQALVNNWGGCEHVEASASTLAVVTYENDSFGREGYCLCAECHSAQQEEEGQKEVVCHDCKLKYPKKETIAWKWYDFYSEQGDEPLIICEACQTHHTHKDRVIKDRQDYEVEYLACSAR